MRDLAAFVACCEGYNLYYSTDIGMIPASCEPATPRVHRIPPANGRTGHTGTQSDTNRSPCGSVLADASVQREHSRRGKN